MNNDETTPMNLADLKPLPYDRSLVSRFMQKHGISATWKRQTGDPKKKESVLFSIVLKRRGRAGEPLVVWELFSYGMGWGCFKDGREVIPEMKDVLSCLISDIAYITNGNTFKDFVRDMGLEKAAIEADGVWQAIRKEHEQLHRLLGADLLEEFVDLPPADSEEERERERAEAEDALAEAAGEQP